ncbi:MAG TPA: hypothetical protein DEA08_30440 [Planctomycetes bacterium]|nr:hypothetical protein [Planctomycetota bacterium]
MNRLTPLLAGVLALSAGATAFAQDETPYYQQQRAVVIFKVNDPITVTSFDGKTYEAIGPGMYRFDSTLKATRALTKANFADGTGPMTQYGGYFSGSARRLGSTSSALRDGMTFTIKLKDASIWSRNRDWRNVLRAAELRLRMRVQLGHGSSTQLSFKGDVAQSGNYVKGTIEKDYGSAPRPKLEILHVKLSLDDSKLPQRKAADFFPAGLDVNVKPNVASYVFERVDYGFELTREKLNDEGAAIYGSDARFPMVHENDYYGHYVSSPHDAMVVVKHDGSVFLRVGWGLGGRYHGWSHTYSATLSAAQFARLKRDGQIKVTGKVAYDFASEDGEEKERGDGEFTLKLRQTSATSGSTAGASGMVTGTTGN